MITIFWNIPPRVEGKICRKTLSLAGKNRKKPWFPSDFPVCLPGEGTSIAPGQRAAAGPGQVKGEGCGPAWSCRRFLKTWKTPSKPSDFVRFPECSLDLSWFECWSIWLSHVFPLFFGEVERSKQWFVSVVNLWCQLTSPGMHRATQQILRRLEAWRLARTIWWLLWPAGESTSPRGSAKAEGFWRFLSGMKVDFSVCLMLTKVMATTFGSFRCTSCRKGK